MRKTVEITTEYVYIYWFCLLPYLTLLLCKIINLIWRKSSDSHCMYVDEVNIDDLQRSIFERRQRLVYNNSLLVQLTLTLSRGHQQKGNWDKHGDRVSCRIREFLWKFAPVSCDSFCWKSCRHIFLTDLERHCKENYVECISQLPILL